MGFASSDPGTLIAQNGLKFTYPGTLILGSSHVPIWASKMCSRSQGPLWAPPEFGVALGITLKPLFCKKGGGAFNVGEIGL